MPPLHLDLRLTKMSQCSGMHVAYSAAMLGGRIDRGAWARAVRELLVRFDPGPRGDGNKSAFARRVGVTTRTIERWIAETNDVRFENVRSIIDALGLTPLEASELLAGLGIHLGDPPAPQDPRTDPVIQEILNDPTLSDDDREELVRMQVERIEQDLARRRADFEILRRRLRQDPDAS